MNFFSRYKRLLLIILFVAFVIGAAYLLYWVFFHGDNLGLPGTSPTETTGTTGRLPEAGIGSIINPAGTGQDGLPGNDDVGTGQSYIESQNPNINNRAIGGITKTNQLVSGPTVSPTINNQTGSIQYYDPLDNKFYKVDQDGRTSALSDKTFYNVSQVTWSKDSDKAVLKYPDGSKVVYDFANKQQVTLPKHWDDFDFSTNSDKLVMKSLGMDPDSRYLAVANNDGSGGKVIEFIGQNDKKVYPTWSPNNQVVALYAEGLDFDRQTVYFLGLNGENFKSMVVPGRGFQHQWSPSGDRLLYSVYYSDNQMKPMLWIADSSGSQIGENRQMLNVQTWVDKCAFASNNEIYCAVPTNLDYGAGFLPALSNQTPDQLYKINTSTGVKQLIAIPDNNMTIGSIMVNPDGSSLFLTNKNTGSINKINLR
jgi:hypothetical protein